MYSNFCCLDNIFVDGTVVLVIVHNTCFGVYQLVIHGLLGGFQFSLKVQLLGGLLLGCVAQGVY